MARSTEVIRQWEILRAIDGARHGIGIPKLAAEFGVHQRTIRRDIDALCRAGFPLFDDKVNGTSRWKLTDKPFKDLERLGMGLTELCALYISHVMLGTLGGTPLLNDAERAFLKIEKALPPECRRFVDRLPGVLKAKARGRKKGDERRLREILSRVLDAILLRRRADMRYASASSRRTKDYVVEPQRIAYADGGLYLVAWVPEYEQIRTFAAERIETFGVRDDTFTPRALPAEPFADSLGVNTGKAERIEIEFEPDVAPYVREREWHASQEIAERGNGGLRLTLNVCNDHALRTWILGFGPSARVLSPIPLARAIVESLESTRRRYGPEAGVVRPTMLSMPAERVRRDDRAS
jgi:predicted DNA-binding transcriptional regulator YafY